MCQMKNLAHTFTDCFIELIVIFNSVHNNCLIQDVHWGENMRGIVLFKYKDHVIPRLISCVELNQIGVVQIIHDLDLILHHLLPKTQVRTDRDR